MRVIRFDGEGLITRELHFAKLPGVGDQKDVTVVIFRDKHGKIHSIRTSDIIQIIDA